MLDKYNPYVEAVRVKKILRSGDVERIDGVCTLDGESIRWVILDYQERPDRKGVVIISIALCIGCVGGCLFCKSCDRKFVRYLTFDELVGQVIIGLQNSRHYCDIKSGKKTVEVYFACEGDMLLSNYDNGSRLIKFLAEADIFSRFVVTTIGDEELIHRYWSDIIKLPKTEWYFSLHSLVESVRIETMPHTINTDLFSLLELFKNLSRKTNKRVTIAWNLSNGLNNSKKDVELIKKYLLKEFFRVKVSLFCSDYFTSEIKLDENYARAFVNILIRESVDAYFAPIKGTEIGAGCGTTIPSKI